MVIKRDAITNSIKNKSKSQKTHSSANSEILETKELATDRKTENTIRPQTLEEYIGQSHIKTSLKITIKAAQERQESMDHILFYGPPGLGKTTLSLVIAHEIKKEIKITSAQALERPRDIVGLLMSIKPGDMLFIDEIHRLNKLTEELLYPAMEDFTIDRIIGKGHAAKILRVPIPKFTLIGATTKAELMSSPLRDRFGIIHRLDYYNDQELKEIILRSAHILKITITDDAALLIGQCSRATPRVANRLLRRVRDYAQVQKKHAIDQNITRQALDFFKVDLMGLDYTDLNLLQLMISKYNGGPVGIEAIAAGLGESSKTIEEIYEPYLVKIGFIQRTSRGRVVTPAVYEHLKLS